MSGIDVKTLALAKAMGGNGAVIAPATASVGQTIVVKAVDENGKPTEWEAVSRDDAKKVTIIDMTAFVPGKIDCSYSDYAELIQRLINDGSSFYEIELACLQSDGAQMHMRATRYKPLLGNKIWIYFGEDVCPIIIDATNNTITLDPDWVAPTAE